MTGITTTEGNGLRLTDMLGEILLPQNLGTIRMDLPEMALMDNGDGTVGVVYPETFAGNVTVDLRGDLAPFVASLDVTLAMQDVVMTVSGQPDDMTYRTTAALYDLTIDNLRMTDFPDFAGTEVFAGFTVEDTESTTRVITTESSTTSEITSTAGRTIFDIGVMPQFGGNSRNVGVVGLTTTTGSITIPAGPINLMDLAAALRDGMIVDVATTSIDQINQNVVYLFDELISEQSQTVAESRQEFSLSQDGLEIVSSGSGVIIDIAQDALLPVPVSIALDRGDVRMAFPVSAAALPQGFDFGLNLNGLTMSDTVIGLIDPTGTLQNTPLTFGVTLNGQMTMDLNLFDFNALMDPALADRFMNGNPPVALNLLSLDRLAVEGFGVALDGNGRFSIDNTDLVTFDGLPKPTGTATFNLTGAQAMIDTLVKLGVMDSEEAMGARMGLGMVGRATGNDSMTSSIEINEAGHVIVNGQRMQ